MGIRIRNLSLCVGVFDQHPDVRVIGQLIEVAGNTRLSKQGQCLGHSLLVLYNILGPPFPSLGFLSEDTCPDVGAQGHAISKLLQPFPLLRRET